MLSMTKMFRILYIFTIFLILPSFAANTEMTESRILAMLGKSANPNFPPDTAVIVNTSLSIEGIRRLDDINMELTTDVRMEIEWVDGRLSHTGGPPAIRLTPSKAKAMVWMPDLSYINARDSLLRENLSPELSIVINNQGHVKATSRISLTTACDMNLRYYPLDLQQCRIYIGNYLYTLSQVKFRWNDENPVTMTTKSLLNNFRVISSSHGTEVKESSVSLYLSLDFNRLSSYHGVFIYIPSLLIVCLSCLVFWFPHTDLPERIIFTGFLFLSTLLVTVLTAIQCPAVGYTKAIDLWVVICLLFLTIALAQTLVIYLISKKRQETTVNANEFELMKEDESRSETSTKIRDLSFTDRHSLTHRLDIITRILYPALFVLFAAIYWAVISV